MTEVLKVHTTLYRGYLIKRVSGDSQQWSTHLNNQAISGPFSQIKRSIDWWADLNVFVPPKTFDKTGQQVEPGQSQEEIYNSFVIKNDSGAPSDWYLYVHGRLLKGKLTSIKQLLDQKVQHANGQVVDTGKQRAVARRSK